MGTMLDVAGALIIRAMMFVAMLGVTVTLNDTMYMKTALNNVQGELTSLIITVESDCQKIGYNSTAPTPFLIHKADTLQFLSDINNDNIVDTVTYYISDTTVLASTSNPRDRVLYRDLSAPTPGQPRLMVIGSGLTQFVVQYYNSSGAIETDPLLMSSITIQITIEHGSYTINNKYPSVYWERRFFPSNL